ncbi:MAG: hypothetical protein ACTSYR_01125, partial [Candidatus Odinarchaeia archaeon]
WSSGPLSKKKIFSAYKAQRTSVLDFHQITALTQILSLLGFRQLMYHGKEADELIAAYVNSLNECTIISDDKDFFQLLGSRKILKGYRRGVITEVEVCRRYKLPSIDLFTDYLTLIGDRVDNVPKILSATQARFILTKKGSLTSWLLVDNPVVEDLPKKISNKLVKLLKQIFINYKLVNLKNEYLHQDYFFPKPSVDIIKAELLLHQYGSHKLWYKIERYLKGGNVI